MPALRVAILRFIDSSFPGFVECAFTDAHGTRHVIHEKEPVVSAVRLDERSTFPAVGVVACEVVGRGSGDVVRVSTARPWGIETVDGKCEFDVVSAALEDDEADVVDGNADIDSDEDLVAV